jgi:RNA recognition motif-containing protein
MLRYNLHFKNLPSGSTEEELREYFSEFGDIKSLKLMKRKIIKEISEEGLEKEEDQKVSENIPALEEGESLGFGFVSFSTIEAAAKAKYESKTKKFKG